MIAMGDEDAFSGLEAAIILIAFIVVAAVFSYTILGTGFSASEKAREVTGEAGSSASGIMVVGTVVGQADRWGGPYLERIIFSCESIGNAVMASDIRYSILTTESITEIPQSAVTLTWYSKANSDGMLSKGDLLGVALDTRSAALSPGKSFTLIVHPPKGQPFHQQCRVPNTILQSNYYEVG